MALFDLTIADREYRRVNLREAIFQVVSAAIEAGSTPEELRPHFPQGKNAWHVLDGQLDASTFREKLAASKHSRFFLDDGELFHVDGKTYALSNQWSQPEWRSAIAAIARRHPDLRIDVRAHGDDPASPQARGEALGVTAATSGTRTEPNLMSADLNLIFFGPPGTGKTYTTISKAVEIVDGTAPDDRSALMSRYTSLREKGLIEFVTFHQSFSYEEFVEGIRPVFENDEDADAETGGIRYECRPGVFRRLCADTDAGAHKITSADFDPEKNQVWKLSLGNTRKAEDALVYDECIENDYVLLGYGGGLDFEGCDTRDAVFERLQTAKPDIKITDYDVTAVHTFKNEMEIGDFIVVSHGNHRFRAIARVTGPYQRLRDGEYGQMRPVEWLLVLDESLPREGISQKVFSQATIYKLKPKSVLRVDKFRELLTAERDASNRVLIIDEINRGNIAKILGELITLLEPDKRRGAPNELRVTLPYSGLEFAVPPNLYIIGTMNTADRSIALLDTALRRRFRFVEMAPDPAVVRACVGENGKLSGVDVARMLEVMNDRIELLYDRDHRLGHAYLLGCKSLDDLRDALVGRIIPLLQEYFHEHWERICLVLGCPHDDAGKPIATDFPIIRARSLRASSLLGASTDFDDRFQYAVEPSFLNGSGSSLRAFFDGITQLEPQVLMVAGQK